MSPTDQMPAVPAPDPARRERDSDATQEAILGAAVEAFTRSGYDGATTREIARRAGVDARLITRYFGSKEKLFEQAVAEAYRRPLITDADHNREVARALLDEDAPDQSQALQLTIRSAANPRAAEIMRTHLEQNFQAQLAGQLAGPDATARAALLIALCAGVQLLRDVLGNEALRRGADDALIAALATALDAIAEPRPTT